MAVQVPKYFDEDLFSVLGDDGRPDHRWLIMGPPRSGSTFHKDPNATSAWNAVVTGSKKWILYPPNVLPPGAALCCSLSCAVLCCAGLRLTALRCAVLRRAALCCAVLCHAVLRCVDALCHAVPHSAMLHCAVLCVLCCAALCCAALCCAADERPLCGDKACWGHAGVHASDDGADVACPVSLIEWFLNFYKETRKGHVQPLEGICRAGEVLFVPRGWWHMAMNLEVGGQLVCSRANWLTLSLSRKHSV